MNKSGDIQVGDGSRSLLLGDPGASFYTATSRNQDDDLERRAAGPFHPHATKGPAITTSPPHQGARPPPLNTQQGEEKDLTYGKKWIRKVAVTK